ncbi:MAG: cytochrome C [Verrucomicrobia bacterium]|nr:cytochrome C [Verrucomicrobiota bacterium]
MPIYEFYSPDSHRIYSFLSRRILKSGELPLCPDNPKHKMGKMISAFAVSGRAKVPAAPRAEAGPDMDPRMEREMMKMADEFSHMDENNPDPRMLGRMMRKMMEASGQKLPGQMGEMLSRLEKGENPDKLEEEYGDVLEKMDGMEGDVGDKKTDLKTRLRRRLPPRRDPQLYE